MGGLEAVNAKLLESYQLDRNAIKALVREGQWAEDGPQRERLVPGGGTTGPSGP